MNYLTNEEQHNHDMLVANMKPNNNPIVYPEDKQEEGWEVVSFKDETRATSDNPSVEFKVITAKDEHGTEYTAIMFSNHSDFKKILVGNKFDGWLRKIDAHQNWVDFNKPARNWNTKFGEIFISYK